MSMTSKMRQTRMTEAEMQQKIMEQEDSYMADAEKLIESWEKKEGMGLGNGVLADMVSDNPYKAVSLVKFLENTEQSFARRLKEYQTSSYLGITPQEIVKVFRFAYGNSITPDLFNVWSMDSVKDTFYKIESKYNSTKRGATADKVIYENFYDGRYPTSYDILELDGDGSTTEFSGTLTVYPAKEYSFKIYDDQTTGGYLGGDDGAGNITSLDDTFEGTIVYATGVYSITFDTAPASGATVYVEYAHDAENEDLFAQVGEVKLALVPYDFRGTFHSMKASWSRMAEEVSESKLGRSARQDILDSIADVVRKSYDEFTCTRAIRASQWATALTFDADFANAGADSEYAQTQALKRRIEDARGVTYGSLGRFPARTNLLVGYRAKAFMRGLNGYNVNTNKEEIGFFKDGDVDGYGVYVGPADVVPRDSIFVIGRGKDAMSTDAVISLGIFKGDIRSDELEYASFKNEVGFGVIQDWKWNNKKMATRINVSNLA
jgi:hypothetical protein